MKFKYYICTGIRRYRLHPGKSYSIGRNEDNDICLTNTSVSRYHSKLTWDENTFLVEDLKSTNGTFLNSSKIKSARLASKDVIRFGKVEFDFVMTRIGSDVMEEVISPEDTIILESRLQKIMDEVDDPLIKKRFSEVKKLFNAKKKNLSDLAYRDTLTGLYNRRSFDKKLDDEWKRQKRYKRQLSLIMIDIDHFKKVNDTYGHQKGDDVLKTVAGIINDNVRLSDYPCRYGGEEMAVILSETSLKEAAKVAEKLRRLVEKKVKEIQKIKVTISLGVSTYLEKMNEPGDLVKSADSCLYKAKDRGRNKVVVC